MWKARTQSAADAKPHSLQIDNGKIRGLRVKNNTPAYLYFGLDNQNLTRDTALIVVEPYSEYTTPLELNAGTILYALHGLSIGPLPSQATSLIEWTDEPGTQLAFRRYGRNITVPLFNGAVTPAGTTATISTQSISSTGAGGGTAGTVAVASAGLPAFAGRRTIIGQTDGAATFADGCVLQFTQDNGATFYPLLNLPSGATSFTYNLDSLALTPLTRLVLKTSQNSLCWVSMVVDL